MSLPDAIAIQMLLMPTTVVLAGRASMSRRQSAPVAVAVPAFVLAPSVVDAVVDVPCVSVSVLAVSVPGTSSPVALGRCPQLLLVR